MLVFDVKILHDAQKYAEENKIRIFWANIIYHLSDAFNKYLEQVREERRAKDGKDAVFPCILNQVATFRKNSPIVLGVDVEYGVLKKGDKQPRLGVVDSIEHNHKKIQEARKATGSVAISIVGDPSIASGKQFEQTDKLVSIISRKSIDALKQHYLKDVQPVEWELIIELKKYFSV